jgi:hypothetical protein
VRDAVQQRERERDRAGGEHERDEDRKRDTEHGDKHEERGRNRDCLAPAKVGREDRIEIVLDRRLSGHDRGRGTAQRRADERRVALRVRQVERRVDFPEEQAAATAELARVGAGDDARSRGEPPSKIGACRRIRMSNAKHRDERAIRPVAELVRKDRARPLGVGAGDSERVREQRCQPCRCRAAQDEDDHPRREDCEPEAEDGAGPTLEHMTTLTALAWNYRWRVGRGPVPSNP